MKFHQKNQTTKQSLYFIQIIPISSWISMANSVTRASRKSERDQREKVVMLVKIELQQRVPPRLLFTFNARL